MNTKWIGNLLLFLLSTNVFAQDSKTSESAAASPLTISAATQQQLGIATAIAEKRAMTDELRAPGEVKANAYATTLVSPRIPAQIVGRHARLGETVKVGQALVTLSSVDVAEAQSALIVSEREWQRMQALGADAISGKRYGEAQIGRDQARAKLRAYGVGDGEIALLLQRGSASATGEFTLVAIQAGRIASDEFIVGERVEPGKILFTVTDENTVWVEAQLAPDVAERVTPGATVRIVGHGQSHVGKVVQLMHHTREASRTTPVRIEVGNDGDRLHTGEFVETFIATTASAQTLVVPTDAIVQLQGQAVVFAEKTGGHFEVLPILAGEVRGEFTVVRQGLDIGTRIVSKGAYVLKARLLKSQLGEE
ncbi:HlyD family efflux transporter periplasmic adaptor subunit [Pseudolysobacter antarcticus]|uniref:HlyD family efflux transporter periplasmic adaptor subunit n=1 Tax=Pseudolysobacter antarcticus TaxID=2511995 RepID=A0A411HF52_9GAMM|nr:efflux RND transporter periplasmic adaptor subunit [Pseudolysobacter antarcticus]QBB69099.1 HlyD family efflux transporter periplasmic adaptor subunit [Pseudolysobacter antarcticus]